jgi:hypothetical protein
MVLVRLNFHRLIVLVLGAVLLGNVHAHAARPRTRVRTLRTLIDAQVCMRLYPMLGNARQGTVKVALGAFECPHCWVKGGDFGARPVQLVIT